MPWTTPKDWQEGELVTDDLLNEQLRDNLNYLNQMLPVGSVLPYAGSNAPSGWLLCDGSAVSRSTYSDLFNVVGTTFGAGDGSTTFNLPDLRGRFPLGLDNMGGNSANRVTASQADSLGGTSGAEDHTLSASELAPHTHNVTFPGRNSTGGDPDASRFSGVTTIGNNFNLTKTSASAGSGSPHNNMPPYISLSFIVRATYS